MLETNQKIRSFVLRIPLRGKMKHFLTKWIAIERLEEFHQSCLVTRKVYHIDTNSLSAMFFLNRWTVWLWAQQPQLFPREHSAIIAASISINWCFLSLKMAANGFQR